MLRLVCAGLVGVALVLATDFHPSNLPETIRVVHAAEEEEKEEAPVDPKPMKGFGEVTGQIILDGEVPEPKILHKKGDTTIRDHEVCTTEDFTADDLVIDKESKGVANVYIYLQKAPTKVHPELAKSASKSVTFDQRGCRFEPHCLFVRNDQAVHVLNGDPVAHNTRTNPVRNTGKNVNVAANDRKGVPFPVPNAERVPFQVNCDFHKWMNARWLVLDHPYAVITDKEGKFTLKGVPVGTHEFTLWHEGKGYLERKLKVEIKSEETTELGELKFPIAKFK